MILRQSESDSPNPGFRFHNRRLCPKNPLGSWVDRPLTTFQFLAGILGMCGGWLPLAPRRTCADSFLSGRENGRREDKIDGSPDFFAVRLRRACLSGLFGTPSQPLSQCALHKRFVPRVSSSSRAMPALQGPQIGLETGCAAWWSKL